jgi:Protein of unknown function (DUF3352)
VKYNYIPRKILALRTKLKILKQMAKKGVIAAALLVTATGAGFAGYKFLHGDSQPNDLASVIPADAYFVTYISTEPEAWAKLRKFGTPEAQKIIGTQLTEFQQKVLAESKMDYVKDLQPWMGNVMVAALPNSDPKVTEPQFLIAIGVKDKLKALDFANKLKAQSKEPIKEIDYKGVKITDSGKGKSETFSALVNDELVISPQQHTLELAIDTAKGSPSLASKAGNDWFTGDTLQLKQPVMAFYMPDYAKSVKQLLASSKTPTAIDPFTMSQLEKVKSIGGGIEIDDAGIRMKMVSKNDGTLLSLPNTSSKAVSNFPADTFVFAGGSGISQIWTEVNKIAAAKPEMQQAFTQMRQGFTQSTQMDLDKDVFGWMSGEYSMGMIPVDKGITAQAGFGGAITIDSNDKAKTDATMTKLGDLAKGSRIAVEQRQVGGKSIVEWKVPGQGTVLSYGWLNDKSLLLTVGEGLMDKMVAPVGETLDRSSNFSTIISTMPQEKQSYMYFDMDRMMTLFNSKFAAMSPTPIPADVNAIVSSIRGVGMTSVQVDKTTNRFEGLLALKPAK